MLKRFIYLIILSFIFLFLPINISRAIRDNVARIFQPLTTRLVKTQISISNQWQAITQIGQLRQQKTDLQQQIAQLEQQLADQEDLKKENESLRQELGITDITRNIPKVYSRVIVRGSNPLDRTFTIDTGVEQGLKVGQPAIFQGFLIGRVIETRQHTAVVRAINSKESRVQAWVSDKREKGLLIGDGNIAYLSDLNQGVTFTSKSVVETSGLGGSLPQGLLIGELGDIQSKPSDISQKYIVNLSQDPNSAEAVFILLTDTE